MGSREGRREGRSEKGRERRWDNHSVGTTHVYLNSLHCILYFSCCCITMYMVLYMQWLRGREREREKQRDKVKVENGGRRKASYSRGSKWEERGVSCVITSR